MTQGHRDQRHCEARRQAGAGAGLWAALLLGSSCGALLGPGGGCAARPSPFPDLGPLPPEESLAVLQRRAAGVRSLYALVRVTFDSPRMRGTFDVACQAEGPHRVRMSAFKDLLLGARPIFDIVFRDGGYLAVLHPEEGPAELRRGRLEDLPEDIPLLASLHWTREALFAPGPRGDGTRLLESGDGGPRTAVEEGRGGLRTVWRFAPRTLEIREAEVLPPGRREPITVRYGDYREAGGAFVPGRVSVRDAVDDFRMEGYLRELEVNIPLDPEVFVLDEERAESSP